MNYEGERASKRFGRSRKRKTKMILIAVNSVKKLKSAKNTAKMSFFIATTEAFDLLG